MKPTEKQKCIAEQAIYGDLVISNHGQLTEMERRCGVNLEPLPVLRPLSDLTKEITHKGYNEDKPFVPLVELLKAYHKGIDYKPCTILKYEIKHDVIYYTAKRGKITFRSDYTFAKSFVWSIQELDLANRLHFDTRHLIKKGEAIDVNTLIINPYSV